MKARTYSLISGAASDGCTTPLSSIIGWDTPTPADATRERLLRRQKIAAIKMREITAILPITTPAMALPWPPECEFANDVEEDTAVEDAVEVAVEDVLTPDVNTPEAPKIAPGPYSGPSISNMDRKL